MTDERWLPIPGWEGLYEASDQGRVRSVDRILRLRNGQQRRYKGRVLRICPRAGNAYRSVGLSSPNGDVKYEVHRLIILTFEGPCPLGMEVRHLDGNADNSALANLAYGTRGENGRDKREHGTDHNVNKTHCPSGHAYSAETVYASPAHPNRRHCIPCMRRRQRTYTDRKRAETARVTTA